VADVTPLVVEAVSRRRFIRQLAGLGLSTAGLGLLAGCGLLAGQAQPATKLPRIAYLTISYEGGSLYPTISADRRRLFEAFQQGLQELRWAASREARSGSSSPWR